MPRNELGTARVIHISFNDSALSATVSSYVKSPDALDPSCIHASASTRRSMDILDMLLIMCAVFSFPRRIMTSGERAMMLVIRATILLRDVVKRRAIIADPVIIYGRNRFFLLIATARGATITRKAPKRFGSSHVETRRPSCGSHPPDTILAILGIMRIWKNPSVMRAIAIVMNDIFAK